METQSTTEKDHSYGIVVAAQKGEQRLYLLVHSAKGHWGFPKGHVEEGETSLEGAARELKEETGITEFEIVHDALIEEQYTYEHEGGFVEKTVTYFLATALLSEPVVHGPDVVEARWATPDEARELITFQASKNVLEKAISILPA